MRYEIRSPGQQFSAAVRKANDVLASSNFIDVAETAARSLAERFQARIEIVDTETADEVVFVCKWSERARPGVVRG